MHSIHAVCVVAFAFKKKACTVMRCTSPKTVGFQHDGKTLAWSPKSISKEFATFQLPCGKCISCRLENARQTAVRCMHEASLFKDNSFITLTYKDEALKSRKLVYKDFQMFVKNLRSHIYDTALKKTFPTASTQAERRKLYNTGTEEFKREFQEKYRIAVFCAGEYGERKKRPHWHCLVFNWRPSDLKKHYVNERGDQVFKSESLSSLWPHGSCDLGSVTFESAGYVARYASKKLIHGRDGEHEFEPISRRSCRHAIGKKWIEKYWSDVFSYGYLVIKNKERYIQCGIPRYYERWLKKNKKEEWEKYVKTIKLEACLKAALKEEKVLKEEYEVNKERYEKMGLNFTLRKTQKESQNEILEQKFKQLNSHLKDI